MNGLASEADDLSRQQPRRLTDEQQPQARGRQGGVQVVDQVVDAVCRYYKVSQDAMSSASRSRTIAYRSNLLLDCSCFPTLIGLRVYILSLFIVFLSGTSVAEQIKAGYRFDCALYY